MIENEMQTRDPHVIETFETDPAGKSAHEPGAKLDQGKNRLSLVLGGFSNALMAVGEVGTFGAQKYSDNGWKQVANAEARYSDAMLRHQLKEMAGEDVDSDSELLHAAHAAWNALAVLEIKLQRIRTMPNWPASDRRVDVIGQNGNDGLHYHIKEHCAYKDLDEWREDR